MINVLTTLLVGCGEPAPPPIDRGVNTPVLEVDTRTPETDLVGWVRSTEEGATRFSDASTGRTVVYRDGVLISAAIELDAARCPAALVALNALGEATERQCEDRRWPLDAGFAGYAPIEPDGGCLVSWDKTVLPLTTRALGGMSDFRGANYGGQRVQLEGMVPLAGDPERFVRPTDALDWGGVPLASIRYRFHDDLLWQVELTPAPGERQAFLDAWTAVFGPGRDGWWHGCDVNASFELVDPDVFTIRSKHLTWERSRGGGASVVAP
jgi:hypothetical protein